MNHFERKYGVKEDKDVKEFHKSRRMFCIFENKLHIADPNVDYSHAVWFEDKGWITKDNDQLMDNIIRGIIDDKGNIYFYSGYDFNINKETEEGFFPHLKELSEILDISQESIVYGGFIKSQYKEWKTRKKFGPVKDLLQTNHPK